MGQRMDGVEVVVCCNLLHGLEPLDRLKGNPCLELGTVRSALFLHFSVVLFHPRDPPSS